MQNDFYKEYYIDFVIVRGIIWNLTENVYFDLLEGFLAYLAVS